MSFDLEKWSKLITSIAWFIIAIIIGYSIIKGNLLSADLKNWTFSFSPSRNTSTPNPAIYAEKMGFRDLALKTPYGFQNVQAVSW